MSRAFTKLKLAAGSVRLIASKMGATQQLPSRRQTASWQRWNGSELRLRRGRKLGRRGNVTMMVRLGRVPAAALETPPNRMGHRAVGWAGLSRRGHRAVGWAGSAGSVTMRVKAERSGSMGAAAWSGAAWSGMAWRGWESGVVGGGPSRLYESGGVESGGPSRPYESGGIMRVAVRVGLDATAA